MPSDQPSQVTGDHSKLKEEFEQIQKFAQHQRALKYGAQAQLQDHQLKAFREIPGSTLQYPGKWRVLVTIASQTSRTIVYCTLISDPETHDQVPI